MPREFHIRAAFEEGGPSSLRHAVSRMDLLCRNAGAQAVPVTLHLDLSDDGRRTDYDSKPEAGMKLRDFLFIQPPGRDWLQVDGTTDRWVATVTFDVPPGETKVGLSPWYTYGDYLRFVNGLPKPASLTTTLLGKSDGGREHWELTITDPAVPAERKRKMFWHAREHAYETFSSFAMEGLVTFLLSDEAAEFRRRFVFTLHPMTNPDGVAQGFEYRAGYDVPKPRGPASARLTFDAIDRLRPDLAVTWHNWIAPRDQDVVFFTDGEEGKATPRAWYLFTQRFPSPRAAGHRWKDETTPQRYNWQGRTPLSEANVHQYAMKKYGTQVWGWEMPWWNRTPDEARRLGAAFARALLGTLEEIRSGPASRMTPLLPLPSTGRGPRRRLPTHRSPPLGGSRIHPQGPGARRQSVPGSRARRRVCFALRQDQRDRWLLRRRGHLAAAVRAGRRRRMDLPAARRGHRSLSARAFALRRGPSRSSRGGVRLDRRPWRKAKCRSDGVEARARRAGAGHPHSSGKSVCLRPRRRHAVLPDGRHLLRAVRRQPHHAGSCGTSISPRAARSASISSA